MPAAPAQRRPQTAMNKLQAMEVFAKVAETEGIDGAELALRVVLGDGKQADIRGTAAGAEGCSVDLLPDGGNVGA